jgi:hypothetical protein
MLRASVQLLHFLPFRPEIDPSFSLVKERSTAHGNALSHPQTQRNTNSQLYPRQPEKSAVKSGKSADFWHLLTPRCHRPGPALSNVPRKQPFHNGNPVPLGSSCATCHAVVEHPTRATVTQRGIMLGPRASTEGVRRIPADPTRLNPA